jgi:hypothetical protein
MPFIVESFLNSYRTSRAAGLISMADWDEVMGTQFRKVLARPGVEAFVAYHPGETGNRANLYAWLAVERGYELVKNDFVGGEHVRRMVHTDIPLVIYAYTKQAYRKMGVCRGLFKAARVGPRWNYATRTAVVSTLERNGTIPASSEWLHLTCRFAKQPKDKPSEQETTRGRAGPSGRDAVGRG